MTLHVNGWNIPRGSRSAQGISHKGWHRGVSDNSTASHVGSRSACGNPDRVVWSIEDTKSHGIAGTKPGGKTMLPHSLEGSTLPE
jgi:hypothetical protein